MCPSAGSPPRARTTGSRWDSYRRLLQMFGATVLHVDAELFSRRTTRTRAAKGTPADLDLTPTTSSGSWTPTRTSSESTPAGSSRSSRASSSTWRSSGLQLLERRPGRPLPPQERIPDDLGTAVNVQTMVFGNRGMTRAPASLHPRPGQRRTRCLWRLPPERPGRGRRGRHPQHRPLDDLQGVDKTSYDELLAIMEHPREPLPRHVRHRVHDRARQALDAADPGR